MIAEKFGIQAELIEGHDGIYEVTINNEVVFTNLGSCQQFPTDGEILGKVRKFAAPLPGQKLTLTEVLPMAGMKD